MDLPPPSEPETRSVAVPRQRAGEPPSTAAKPDSAPRTGTGRRRWRRYLVVALLAVAVAAAGTVGYGLLWYDQQTRPDRSTPDGAVSNYLRALLVDRDDTRAALFTCPDVRGLAPMRELRRSIEDREQRLHVSVLVSWGQLEVGGESDRAASVATEIRLTASIDGNLQSVTERWTFRVEDRDGWRVCSAARSS